MPRKLLGLLAKDLYLHWREVCGAWAGFIAFAFLLMHISPPHDLDHRLFILLPGNLFLNLPYSEFLIYRERTKGTIGWLRSMPLSDGHVIASKFLALGIIQILGYFLTTLLIAPKWLVPRSTTSFAAFGLFSFCFGTSMLSTRWLFGQRFGQAIPLGAYSLLLFGFVKARAVFPSLNDWLRSGPPMLGLPVFALFAVAWSLATGCLTARILASKDTDRLID